MLDLTSSECGDLREQLYQMADWMRQAEQLMSTSQRWLHPHFVAEGRLLREWAEQHAQRTLGGDRFPTPVR